MSALKAVTSLLIASVLAGGLWLIVFGPPIDDSALRRHMALYDEQRFINAQQTDALVLINFHKSFCPACLRQKRVLARYFIDFPDSHLQILEVDYDANPALVRRFGAVDATTLVMFRGDQRIWYNHGQTEAPALYSAFRQAEYHTHLFAEDDK